MIRLCILLAALGFVTRQCVADVITSPVFGDSMVVQRDMPIKIWGWTRPNTAVRVMMAGQEGQTTSDARGRFDVFLAPLPAGGPHELIIQGDETRTFKDVLVGEVWMCSGQSNMAWPVARTRDADLELLTAKYPNIRLLAVPQVGTQEPQQDFNGHWTTCTPETVRDFSAIGYFFGRQLHQILDVPVGLIDNAWNGSTAEAWVSRAALEADGKYAALLEEWDKLANDPAAAAAKWNDRAPRQLAGNHRPSNIYNGVLHPTIGYTLRGVIWYQGESNVGRADQYRDLFPLLIESWRQAWGQGDFPFYWVQLADFRPEVATPGDSQWAALREAQTMTLSRVPNTGEAVIIDLGDAADIHPRNKLDVAKRLVRWALTHDYGMHNPLSPEGAITHHSPTYTSMTIDDSRATLQFLHVNGGLSTVDGAEPVGFAIAGDDRIFVNAQAKITDPWGTIEVWSDTVKNPVAVRYAWADNPVCNVRSTGGLPMTPFRTDDW